MAQGTQQTAGETPQTLPEMLDELGEAKDKLNKVLEATGQADKVKHFDALLDMSSANHLG
jgi:hypothetical protein